MSVWWKVALTVLAAVVVSTVLVLLPAVASVPRLPRPSVLQREAQQAASQQDADARQEDRLLRVLLLQPLRPAGAACTTSANLSGVFPSHSEFVRIAICLNRRHLVSATTVAAVKASRLGRPDGKAILVSEGFQTKETGVWPWAWFLTWVVALALIAVVVFLHLRRRPPADALRASG